MNNTSIILTPHVINTVKALADADRKVSHWLKSLFLGAIRRVRYLRFKL